MPSPEDRTPVILSNRYQVLSVLGDGGFGKTFLVEDIQMPSNRKCVLKQLKPVHDNPQTSQMVKDRFGREAAILEKLGEGHEQIPRLYAYFSEADQFYLVEEWVQGDTLTQRVQTEGPLPEKTVQNILANLLPVVAHVHSEGIVHRDIKPDNIILRQKDGKPVLIDFGAVKETMNTIIDSHAHSSHSIVVGTPGYMPAEQLSGRPVFASDLYSLGMTAIYALTAKIPQELEIDPRTGELLWRQYAPNLTPEFGNFLDCAIHMSAQSRFPVVQEMLSILNGLILNGMTVPAPVPPGSNGVPETRQSSQTIISAPLGSPDSNYQTAAVAPAAAYSYQGSSYQSANTEMAMPPTGSYAAAVPSGAQPAAQSTGQSTGQWKNAVIIGGMVGFSVLLGALVVMDRLPGAADASPEEPVEIGTVEEPRQKDDKVTTEDLAADPAAEPDIPPPTPVAPSVIAAPQTASVPGANSSIVGQPGSKNIRSGPGTTYGVVDAVIVGDRVKVVDRSTDLGGNPWYRVLVPSGNSGWVAGQLIQVDGDAAPPRAQSRPQQSRPQPPADNTNATIAGQSGSKNIRSGPGTEYGAAHIAYPGDRVVIRNSGKDSGGYDWYEVYFPKSGASGWIAAQLVSPD